MFAKWKLRVSPDSAMKQTVLQTTSTECVLWEGVGEAAASSLVRSCHLRELQYDNAYELGTGHAKICLVPNHTYNFGQSV